MLMVHYTQSAMNDCCAAKAFARRALAPAADSEGCKQQQAAPRPVRRALAPVRRLLRSARRRRRASTNKTAATRNARDGRRSVLGCSAQPLAAVVVSPAAAACPRALLAAGGGAG